MRSLRVASAAAAAQVVVVGGAAATIATDGALATIGACVLAPCAVFAVGALAARIGPRWFAYAAPCAYVGLPFVAWLYFIPTYRQTFVHGALPDLLGLRATGWFALGVGLAVLAAHAPARALAVAGLGAAAVAVAVWGVAPLADVRGQVHETGWSVLLLEWVPIAGLVGVARYARPLAAGLGGWLAFFVVYGSHLGYAGAAFWQSLSAALPAAAVLVTALALLIPPLRRPAETSSAAR
jgi:hypothetical protein